MKINLKNLVHKFNYEYNIKEPSLLEMSRYCNCHKSSIYRLYHNPNKNINCKLLGKIISFLFTYYHHNFPEISDKKFQGILIKELIDWE